MRIRGAVVRMFTTPNKSDKHVSATMMLVKAPLTGCRKPPASQKPASYSIVFVFTKSTEQNAFAYKDIPRYVDFS